MGMTEKPTVFISYNWGCSKIADDIENRLKPYAVVKRDKSSVGQWGDLIEFMESIRDQDFAVLIISDAYLKSEGCLYEVLQLMKEKNWDERVMYVVTDDARDLYDTGKQLPYISYWEEKAKNLSESIKKLEPANVYHQSEDLRTIQLISHSIGEFMAKVKRTKNPEMEDSIQAIIERVCGKTSTDNAWVTVPESDGLTKELVAEVTKKCKKMLLNLHIDELEKELDKLFAHNLSYTDETKELFVCRFLIDVRKNNNCECIVPVEFQEEAEWVKQFFEKPFNITPQEFSVHSPEVQSVLIDKLFTCQFWDSIICLNDAEIDLEKSVKTQLIFHAGLSFFNLQEYKKAGEIFRELANAENDEKYKLFTLCSDIQIINSEFRNGGSGDYEKLENLLGLLPSFKQNPQYKQNEFLMAILYLEGYYHLGFHDPKYLDNAFAIYETFKEDTKNNPNIKYQLALCYEINEDFEKARNLYSELDWENNDVVAQRYLLSLTESRKCEEAITSYKRLKCESSRVDAVYLLALSNNNDIEYEEELKKAIDKYDESIEDIFAIAFYTENRDAFDKYIVPVLKKLLKEPPVSESIQIKNGLMLLFARWDEIELLEIVVSSLSRLDTVDLSIVHNIYESLLRIINEKYGAHEQRIVNDSKTEAANRIADAFVNAGIAEEKFLQIKMLYYDNLGMKPSLLKASKRYYELTNDKKTAKNIVVIQMERNVIEAKEYEPYLDALKKAERPEYCVIIAAALQKQGKMKEADHYAYKAMYLLDNQDDFVVFKMCLGYYYTRGTIHDAFMPNAIGDNMVVTLESIDENSMKDVCLDSENEFNNPNNRSLEIEHICRNEILYAKLQGKKEDDIVSDKYGKKYRIVSFMPREHYAVRFLFKKISQHPEKFGKDVKVITWSNIEELTDQINALTDRSNAIDELLASYYREDGGMGIPIDGFVNGNYERYPEALSMLLFGKDQAFYSGYLYLEDFDDSKFVPTLSTMMIIGMMGRIPILEELKDSILIPESYLSFFQKHYAEEVKRQEESPGSLGKEDGKLVFYETNKKLLDVWERLAIFCESATKERIADEDRITYEIVEGVTGERLLSATGIDIIQLDSLILAKKTNAYYLCDDLFFRKIAEWIQLRSCNIASLLYHIPEKQAAEIALELSKTNYIHTPLIATDKEQMKQMYDNLMKGKRKKEYYSQFFNAYEGAVAKELQELVEDNISEENDDRKKMTNW